MFDNYQNTPATIVSGLEILEKECKNLGLHIQLQAASEYYVDEGLIELILKGEVLTIADKYLLFETSYTHRPYRLEEVIFEIGAAGHTPMLAHPERYRYMSEGDYIKIKELGVMFQVNLNSFNGYYGSTAKKNAHFLSENGMIDFLGSDTHNMHQLQNLEKVLQSDDYKKIYLKNSIKNNLL
jgi:protein-tyrosine phosphatase